MLFSRKRHSGLKPELLACFLFGIIFIAVILTISLNYSEPTQFQSRVFITVLSLAGAGIAAVIPGLIEIRFRKAARVTGAIAIFTLIYFNHPCSAPEAEKPVRPVDSSLEVAGEFLRRIDSGDIEQAYQLFIAAGHDHQDINLFRQVYNNIRLPLGEIIERKIVNIDFGKQPPDYPVGQYDSISWQSKFSADGRCYYEDLILKATEERKWGMSAWHVSEGMTC